MVDKYNDPNPLSQRSGEQVHL